MSNEKKKQTKKSELHGLTFLRREEKLNFKLEYIIWKDHTSTESGWKELEDGKPTSLLVHSVGWCTGEDEEAIAIAQNVGANNSLGNIMTILKSCIVHREIL